MNTDDSSAMGDSSSADELSAAELQQQLKDSLQQLSPEQLQALADFAAYLADAGGEATVQELLAIPGLLERVKQIQATPNSD